MASLVSACSGGSAAPPVALPQSALVSAAFRTAGGSASLRCNLTGADGSAMGSASLALLVSPTLWPLYDDVLTVAADGVLHSAVTGASANVSAALTAATCSAAGAAAAGAAGLLPCSLAAGVASVDAALAAAQPAFAGGAAAGSAASVFTPTLGGATVLILVARSGAPAFASATTVTLGGVACAPVRVSADGAWLATRTPSAAALQCTGAGDCGSAVLVVTNPAAVVVRGAGRLLAEAAANASAGAAAFRGVALACPPFCPGAAGAAYAPLPIDSAGGAASFVPATRGASQSSPLVALAPADYAATSAGVYYATPCAAPNPYTDPASGACRNASDPASARCAFGSGASCVMCPTGEGGGVHPSCLR